MKIQDNDNRLSPEDPVSSRVFMDKILKRFNVDLNSSASQLSAQWNIVAGSMAGMCSFVSLKDGNLTVACNHPAKAASVRMSKNELVKSIKAVFPDLEIKKVTVRLT